MSDCNRFGLTRDVPSPEKRLVRQECGFACVLCGRLGMHYDHFDPEFKDCEKHQASGIALLCPTCHQDKTAGRLSVDHVRVAREESRGRWKNPAWQSQFRGGTAVLKIGSNSLSGPRVGLSFGPVRLFTIEASKDKIEPWTFTGILCDGDTDIVEFDRNEVKVGSENWDVELAGKLLTFRRRSRDIVLRLSLEPNELRIDRLNLKWPSGVVFRVEPNGDIVLKNLRHTVTQNSARHLIFRDNIAVGRSSAAPGGSIAAFRNCSNFPIGSMTLALNKIVCGAGIVDVNNWLTVDEFLSEDMLEIRSDSSK